jgi:tetratricopeptide (TPR) repeat protein
MSRQKYADWKELLGLYEKAYGEEAPQGNYAKLIFPANTRVTLGYDLKANNHGPNEIVGSGHAITMRPGRRTFSLTYDEPHYSAGSRKSDQVRAELDAEAGHVYQINHTVQGTRAVITITDVTNQELGKALDISLRTPYNQTVTIREIPLTAAEITQALERANKNAIDNPDSAIQDCTRVLNSSPGTWNSYLAYSYRGMAYWMKDEHDAAVSDLSAALSLSTSANAAPSSIAIVYYFRGRAYNSKKNYDRAITDITQAIRLDSSKADFYAWRGNAYYFKENYIRARSDADRALALDPDNVMAKLLDLMLNLTE